MEQGVFHRFRDLIYERSGIVLRDDKISLLSSRIQKRLRECGLKSEAQYLEIIELDLNGHELVHLIDAISTNTTYFWREAEHFSLFAEILARWRSEGKTKLRVWCAAASTGQEPYTLAMEMLECFPRGTDVKLLATDVSTRVLKKAQLGTYSQAEVDKLPENKRRSFLHQVGGLPSSENWGVIEAVKNIVTFKRLNLIEFPYPLKGPIDVIFCRNVMIYFDQPVRQKIINECQRLLAPGGFLFLSLSESLLGVENTFEKYANSVYRRPT